MKAGSRHKESRCTKKWNCREAFFFTVGCRPYCRSVWQQLWSFWIYMSLKRWRLITTFWWGWMPLVHAFLVFPCCVSCCLPCVSSLGVYSEFHVSGSDVRLEAVCNSRWGSLSANYAWAMIQMTSRKKQMSKHRTISTLKQPHPNICDITTLARWKLWQRWQINEGHVQKIAGWEVCRGRGSGCELRPHSSMHRPQAA